MTRPTFVVYSRPGCHLCDVLVSELQEETNGQAAIEIRNIEDDATLLKRFSLRIPVLALGRRLLCEGHLDRSAVQRALAAATGSPG